MCHHSVSCCDAPYVRDVHGPCGGYCDGAHHCDDDHDPGDGDESCGGCENRLCDGSYDVRGFPSALTRLCGGSCGDDAHDDPSHGDRSHVPCGYGVHGCGAHCRPCDGGCGDGPGSESDACVPSYGGDDDPQSGGYGVQSLPCGDHDLESGDAHGCYDGDQATLSGACGPKCGLDDGDDAHRSDDCGAQILPCGACGARDCCDVAPESVSGVGGGHASRDVVHDHGDDRGDPCGDHGCCGTAPENESGASGHVREMSYGVHVPGYDGVHDDP